MPAKKEVIPRFFSKVEIKSLFDCWLWTGGLTPGSGYGIFSVNRKPVLAHRWSYEYHIGTIPEGLHIDHLCGIRNCVNPAHLEAVTPKENLLRKPSGQKTHCKVGHPLTEENTIIYSDGHRLCRICHKAHYQTRYQPSVSPSYHKKEGHSGNRTHCRNGHLYDDNTIYIHTDGTRSCRICDKNTYKRHYIPTSERSTKSTKRGYTKKQWEELKEKYNHLCLCCGKGEPEIKLTADHVVPLVQNGPRDISNIQPLCRSCNSRKHAKFIDFRPKNA